MKLVRNLLILWGLLAVAAAQFFPTWSEGSEYDSLMARRSQPSYSATQQRPSSNQPQTQQQNPVLEQRAVDAQNRALERLFARTFNAATPVEFQSAVVQLFFRSQRELDLCGEFLWETHLLKEYRQCAVLTRQAAWRQAQVLAEDIRALTAADYDYQNF
ncbi:uncharacterized protein LOC129717788 [Wyeomyia smithii]|uniref:uncharacterized protein LOC129717788 n=1 Tax=Wyeomyia smithii TaxID=174621 RepID=UPI0024681E21|nr:uncharacterized protein LOC129717788 [Wyeomyia smithii]